MVLTIQDSVLVLRSSFNLFQPWPNAVVVQQLYLLHLLAVVNPLLNLTVLNQQRSPSEKSKQDLTPAQRDAEFLEDPAFTDKTNDKILGVLLNIVIIFLAFSLVLSYPDTPLDCWEEEDQHIFTLQHEQCQDYHSVWWTCYIYVCVSQVGAGFVH